VLYAGLYAALGGSPGDDFACARPVAGRVFRGAGVRLKHDMPQLWLSQTDLAGCAREVFLVPEVRITATQDRGSQPGSATRVHRGVQGTQRCQRMIWKLPKCPNATSWSRWAVTGTTRSFARSISLWIR